MGLGPFSDQDEREDEYWKAVVENDKLRKARDKGYLTEEGYRALRNRAEDYYTGGDPDDYDPLGGNLASSGRW